MTRLLDLKRLRAVVADAETVVRAGRVIHASGITIEATLPQVALGTACELRAKGGKTIVAEVVGFSGQKALLMPFGDISGIGEGCPVIPRRRAGEIPVGPALLGRVVNAAMEPMDGGPPLLLPGRASLNAPPPSPMARERIAHPLITGVRAMDGVLTCGEGQRVGIMAGPGVGKSSLLGMLARSANADIIVVGLVGERGREVREFVERDLGPGLSRSVVVVATADEPPLVRVRAAMAATSAAEYFRSQGMRVLLMLDSLTRVAMAQREIGLAAGEPPTSRGYPPSVFALLPRLVERAGNGAGKGSITAMYTVLVEGDDLSEPVADAARAALDGHVVLSRKLANGGHYPAIDILASVSRVMNDVVSADHRQLAGRVREMLGVYAESSDLVEVGAYVAGSNPRLDRALKVVPKLLALFRQSMNERYNLVDTLSQIRRALEGQGDDNYA